MFELIEKIKKMPCDLNQICNGIPTYEIEFTAAVGKFKCHMCHKLKKLGGLQNIDGFLEDQLKVMIDQVLKTLSC